MIIIELAGILLSLYVAIALLALPAVLGIMALVALHRRHVHAAQHLDSMALLQRHTPPGSGGVLFVRSELDHQPAEDDPRRN